ncbi:MAG: DUF3299 domain-containing protein [Burkholderiales bacterium]
MSSRSWLKWSTAWALSLGLAAGVGSGMACAVTASDTQPIGASVLSKPTANGVFREIKWDELVPKDWEPMKEFKNINFSLMKDSDPRANEMLKRMRETWDNAPTNNDMDGVSVRIPGYLVPLEETAGGLKEFLLVPYFGACIHTPPPPANQIIYVKADKPPKGFRSMDTVWVSGTLKTVRSDSYMGASGYRMDAAVVERYVESK